MEGILSEDILEGGYSLVLIIGYFKRTFNVKTYICSIKEMNSDLNVRMIV